MSERGGHRRDWTTLIGSITVLVGLGFFVVIFAVLLPVLTDPAGAYDRWFPQEEASAELFENEDQTVESVGPVGPTAGFRYESVVFEATEPPVYRVRLTSESIAGDAELAQWTWDVGDGSVETGQVVTHDYATPGTYTIALTVTDSSGRADTLVGEVSAGEDVTGGASRLDPAGGLGADLGSFREDIGNSLEGAVGSVGDDITETIDSALGSIGSTIRGGVAVVLFGLSALAATMVAWRTARIGVMLLTHGRITEGRRLLSLDRAEDVEPRRSRLEAVG